MRSINFLLTYLLTIKHITIFSYRNTAHWCTCIVRATQSNCCGALDFLSRQPRPQQPRAESIVYKNQGVIHIVRMSRESKGLKKSSSDELNSGNALMQQLSEKCDFRVFSFCQVVSRCTSVYTTWRLDTCRHSANPCPAFLVVVTYARLVVVNWTFHVLIWLRTGDGRLPMPVPHLGTFYLTVSRTFILLCKPSNATLRLSFFLHTSTFSAFQVSYKNALYKSTVIIIIKVLQLCSPGAP